MHIGYSVWKLSDEGLGIIVRLALNIKISKNIFPFSIQMPEYSYHCANILMLMIHIIVYHDLSHFQ